jgi:L-fucose mutarotase/ribose pyranase (RbsD/FucU family)
MGFIIGRNGATNTHMFNTLALHEFELDLMIDEDIVMMEDTYGYGNAMDMARSIERLMEALGKGDTVAVVTINRLCCYETTASKITNIINAWVAEEI